MERYCDVVVLRHPEKGAVQRAHRWWRRLDSYRSDLVPQQDAEAHHQRGRRHWRASDAGLTSLEGDEGS
eukprot:766142-Hanusia_phi.AAC.1